MTGVQDGCSSVLESFSSNANGGSGLTEDKARRMGLMGQYANGPLSAALAYTTIKLSQIAGGAVNTLPGATTNPFGVITPAGAAPILGQGRTGSLTQLGASYDFGVAKLAGTYNTGKNGGTATSLANTSVRAYQIGVSAPFGAFVPYLLIGKETNKNDVTNVNSRDIRQTQLGVRYNLSKRTMAYAMYGNETDNAVVALNGAAYKNTRTVFGIWHGF